LVGIRFCRRIGVCTSFRVQVRCVKNDNTEYSTIEYRSLEETKQDLGGEVESHRKRGGLIHLQSLHVPYRTPDVSSVLIINPTALCFDTSSAVLLRLAAWSEWKRSIQTRRATTAPLFQSFLNPLHLRNGTAWSANNSDDEKIVLHQRSHLLPL